MGKNKEVEIRINIFLSPKTICIKNFSVEFFKGSIIYYSYIDDKIVKKASGRRLFMIY